MEARWTASRYLRDIFPPIEDALNGVAVQALLDTGSTTSAVTTRVADALTLRRLGKRPLDSAQGEGQAERFIFRIGFPIGESNAPRFPYIFEEVRGFELSNSYSLDALIGMDIPQSMPLRDAGGWTL